MEAQIDVIDQMREREKEINTLRHDRIDKINRDIANFDSVVAELVEAVAADLKDAPAEEAVLKLENFNGSPHPAAIHKTSIFQYLPGLRRRAIRGSQPSS